MNDLTETQKAYLAGFFDGEGCVSISKFQGPNNKTPAYQLHVVIAQKADMLSGLRDLADVGTVHGNNHGAGRFYHQWRMSPREGTQFLKAILPYLIVKRKEAEIAIEFQEKQGHKNGVTTGRGWMVPQDMIDEKEHYYQILRDLKGEASRKGRHP